MVSNMAAISAAVLNPIRKKRIYQANSIFEHQTDNELRARYRFGTAGLNFLTELLQDTLERKTGRSCSLTVKEQVLITLRYLASGAHMQAIGDTVGRDKSTVSRTVESVVGALCDKAPQFINFVGQNCDRTKAKFYSVAGFPNVIGCVDGTHVRIMKPGGGNERPFINRKHFPSINVMAVCDEEGRFTYVNAKWPGSAHDSFVFNSSSLKTHLDRNIHDISDGLILGDSGYACTKYTMTPYRICNTRSKELYNKAHSKTRVIIENTFGRLKRRFGILHGEIRQSPQAASKVILACTVLHNIAIMMREPEVDDQYIDQPQPAEQYSGPEEGASVREYITRHYF